jgi:hypothetical protein
LLSLLGLAAVVGLATTTHAGPTPFPILDHFKCNKLRVKIGKAPRGTEARFTDQFDSHIYAMKQAGLCAPASKNGSVVNDGATHLFSYPIKPSDGLKITAHLNSEVTDQFGTFRYDTEVRGLRALVPAAKSIDLAVFPSPPDFSAHGVNHFVCYPVVATPGTPRFAATTAEVDDQFTSAPVTLNVKAPKFLCAPASKEHAGNNFEIKPVFVDPPERGDHLMCYGAKRGKGGESFVKLLVNTADQMVPTGTQVLLTGDELLCNPASKTVCTQAWPDC